MSCDASCRWEVRALTFDKAHGSSGLVFGPRIGPELAMRLLGAPFGCHREGNHLTHPERPDPRTWAGIVEAAWVMPGGIHARVHLADDAVIVRRGLRALEQAGRLRDVAHVSLVVAVDTRPATIANETLQYVTAIRRVDGLDLVSYGAMPGSCVLRSIPPDEVLGSDEREGRRR